MSDTFRWGIIGTGTIAGTFAQGLKSVKGAELAAVGSRRRENSEEFGDRFDIPGRYESYEELASDPSLDAVYIATPHSLHRENTILCLQSGKPVLCEKPFAINAQQAEEMIQCARDAGLFLMEAMWTRFFPAMDEVRKRLASGILGDIRMLSADFGFRAGRIDPGKRLFNPGLGGGALLDVGIYPVSLASMIFGTPARTVSMADIGDTGVDEQSAVVFGYPEGGLAILYTAIRTATPHEAVIMGTEGRIRIHPPWWKPESMTIQLSGKDEQDITVPFRGNGYNYEAREVMECVRSAETESEVMPLDESLSIMQTMDTVRSQWNLKYPMEE